MSLKTRLLIDIRVIHDIIFIVLDKQKANSNKRRIIATLLVGALIMCGYLTYRYVINHGSDPQGTDTINYGPPTDEEKTAGELKKQEIIEQETRQRQPSSLNNPNPKNKNVDVIITDASQYDDIIEVRSFVPNHYEDGTCTIKFEKDSDSFSKSAPAYKDISTTICTNPEIKRSEFSSSGNWTVIVSYSSATASGNSEKQKITIK